MLRPGGRGPSPRRPAVLAATLSFVLLAALAACSGTDPAAPSVPPPASSVATAAATRAPAASWAQNVCDVTTDLRGALAALGAAIDTVPSSDAAPTVGAPGFAAARSGVQARLGGVVGATAGLDGVGRPPVVVLEPVGGKVKRSSAVVDSEVRALVASAGAVTAARTLAELAPAVRELGAPLASTSAAVDDLVAVLREQSRQGRPAIRRAFAAAPSCGSLVRE